MNFFAFTPLLHIFVTGYYLSPNELSRDAAEQYCQLQCNSHLSGFQNTEEYTKAIEIASNNKYTNHLQSNDIWIGLTYANDTNEWFWSDNLLDFENNIDQNPFQTNILSLDPYSNKHCTILSASFDYKFESKECDNKHIFLCNSCDNIINKYIIISTENHNYTQSNIQCNNYFHTTLASIHNKNDHTQTKLLCSNNNDKSCWIGLNDRQTEGDYKWLDNTTFDFGNDISGGIYPWGSYSSNGNIIKQPNAYNTNIDCIDLWQKQNYSINNFDFNDDDCSIEQPFICNLPSTICTPENWDVMSGPWRFHDTCDVENIDHINNVGESVILMDVMNNKWNQNIIIDYMFKIFDIRNIGGKAGISMQFNNEYVYFIGFIVSSNEEYVHLVLYNNDNIEIESIDITNMYIIGTFYALKIQLNEDNTLKIYINDELYMEYLMDLVDLPIDSVLNKFGIINNRLSMHTKSLYISGSTLPIITTQTPLPDIKTTTTTMDTTIDITLTINSLYNSSNISTTEIKQTDNNNETNNTNRNLISFSVENFILLFIGVIISVCIILCLLYCCLLYCKRYLLSQAIKNDMMQFDNPPNPTPLHHIPVDSIPSCLDTENILTKSQSNIELEITENNNNINDINIDINNINATSRISTSSVLYDDYVTKGSQIVNILNIPLPKSPISCQHTHESMNEGYDRKQNIKYNTPTTSVSELFGTGISNQYQHLKIPIHDRIGNWSSENEILEDENEDINYNHENNEMDGNQTKLSIYQ